MKFTVSNGVIFCEHGTAANPVCDECRIFDARKSEATPTPLESLIEAECTKILEQDGWRALRTDPVSDKGRAKGFGELGMADHLYIRYAKFDYAKFDRAAIKVSEHPVHPAWGEILWIEFKRPGKKPKKHQIEWHTKERARGALTLIAGEDFTATVEGFREWYAASGLSRQVAPLVGRAD